MTNFPEQLFTALKSVILSDRERANMRMQVHSYMQAHPLHAPAHVRMLMSLRHFGQSFSRTLNSSSFLTHPALAACALVLCVGIGTSFAASTALPGEPLYAFKTRVNEPLAGAVAFSPAAKAEWSAELTNRRLEEAELLAVSGKLSPVTSAAIENGLESALHKFNASVSVLSERNGQQDVVDVQSDLEASLNAHETVLASLSGIANSDVMPLVTRVHEHAEKITNKRYDTEVTIAEKSDDTIKTAALKTKRNAEKKMQQTSLLGASATGTAMATSVAQISEEAASDIRIGDSEAKKGKWGKAYSAFQSAVRKLKETQTNADVREKLKAEIQKNLSSNDVATSTAWTTDPTEVSTSSDDTGAMKGESEPVIKLDKKLEVEIEL